ncbi:hypothetical protein DFJ74DRAFT_693128 [Hyaloraphidium curvatum]|nr:hypothetical protein DFJ74DRAFT_693128 [Hyaloraphidium curvatum]
MLCIVGIFGWGAVEFWTPLVTFAGATWSSPWRAALSAYVLACLAIYVVNHGIDLFATDFALIGLEGRLQARAAAVCLSDLVSRHCTATEGGVASTGLDSPGAAASSTAAPRAPEPFVYLHQAMAPVWRSFKGSTSSVMLQLGFIGVNVLVSVLINIIGAGCVTAWQFFAIFNTCTLFLRPFINAAVANRSTSAVAALYRRCRTDLDRLLLDRPDHPDAARMRDCARLLGVFESSAREDRATVLGFVADLGFLRGAMLALVTVGVGMLHGILRGAGVTVTMQTVCPA